MPKGNPNPKNQFTKGNKNARMQYADTMTDQMNFRALKSQLKAFRVHCKVLGREPASVLRDFVIRYGGWKP